MGYDDATEFVEILNDALLSDIIYILRHIKGVNAKDLAKMTVEEVRYYSILVQEDLRRERESASNP